jgi:tetratricopeptide (TPR) repeat protein
LVGQLDGLTSDIGDLLHRLSTCVDSSDNESHAMTNLTACIASAKRFVTAAIRVVNARVLVPNGRVSPGALDFTDQRRHEISSWIPKPTSSNEPDYIDSEGPADSLLTVTTYDREYVNTQTLLKFATLAYEAQKYDEAIALLQKFRTRSEARYGQNFENRNELLVMLATTYCRQKNWENAESIVRMDFAGRDEAVKTLVWCYCEERKWSEAETVLCAVADFEGDNDTDTDETLAEIYRGKGEYDKALKVCDKILRNLGEGHVQFYVTLSFMVHMYEKIGDDIEAAINRANLPAGIGGISCFPEY